MLTFSACEAAGASGARLSLRPLLERSRPRDAKPSADARGIAESWALRAGLNGLGFTGMRCLTFCL